MELHWRSTHGLQTGNLAIRAQSLRTYTASLAELRSTPDWNAPEASILLPDDPETISLVEEMVVAKVSPALRYIIVIGIGGSNLGTQAVTDALVGYSDGDRPRIVFIDTTNATVLQHHIQTVVPSISSPDEVLLVSISKSGGTTETIANTEILLQAYGVALGDVRHRTVVITDAGSAYATAATAGGIDHLALPRAVGGRYSVLSAVGLFPLAALGVDVSALRQGAQAMLSDCLYDDWEHNPAIQSATITALWYEAGKTVNDTFMFHTELESLGKWYRQLLGESVGKAETIRGRVQPTGMTPTVSIGSTDLHSVGQLYLGGPKYSLTTFVHSNPTPVTLTIPEERIFPDIVPSITGRTTSDIMDAILEGTQSAYQKQDLPFMTVQLAGITAYELGAFMQFKMCEMMYLGKLLSVNPFDQPNVESYKVETKRILES